MIATPPEQFGQVLRRMREAAGHTQESLAELTGLSTRGISDIERGVRATPRLETVRLLADGLGLSDVQRKEFFAVRNATNTSPTTPVRERAANLPTPANSFVGRAKAIDSIMALLRAHDARLLTLTGPGGVGKTRIAIEVAHQIQHEFAQGAVFLDLSPLQNSELVLPAIATRLGVIEQPGTDLKSVLQVALQDREMMLVLDNLEQVIGAAPDIAWLLLNCPRLTVLATSRIVLRIAAEHIYEIEPMEVTTREPQQQSDAVSLFIERATAANNQFTLDEDNAEMVRDLVARLQGMPLAIELAAAQVRLWPVAELLAMLDTQSAVLGSGNIDSPERHRSMRHTIAWSYDLLSLLEQAVFRSMSIFPDGCTLDSAVAVLGVRSRFRREEVHEAVGNLIDSSLLRAREGVDGRVRYRMLSIVREFGLEQLDSAGEEWQVRRDAHLEWCLPLARSAEYLTVQHDAVSRMKRLDAEIRNLREHVAWLIEHDEVIDALDIAGMLASYYEIHGPYDAARRELEQLLEDRRTQRPSLERLRALVGLCQLPAHSENERSVRELMEVAESMARELGEPIYLQFVLWTLSMSYALSGQIDLAEKYLQELQKIGKVTEAPWINVLEMQALSIIAESKGDWDLAYQLKRDSVTISWRKGYLWLEALSIGNFGYLLLLRNELDEAESMVLQAKKIWADLGTTRSLPMSLLDLSAIARLRGDVQSAKELAEEGLVVARDIGSLRGTAENLRGLAQIALMSTQPYEARQRVYDAIHWFEQCGYVVSAVQCLDVFADFCLTIGLAERAAWCIGAVDGVLQEHGITRTELPPGEHQQRLDSLTALLDEPGWRANYERGFGMGKEEILDEVRSWNPFESGSPYL